MSLLKALAMCCSIVLLVQADASAADSEKGERSLRGKHRIDLGVGFLSGVNTSTEVSADGITTESQASGVIGSLAYTYYLQNDVGLTVRAGIFDADVTTSVSSSGVTAESASVVPLLFGVKYQPSRIAVGGAGRPYASVSLGPYFGSASNVRAGVTSSTQSVSEAALGVHLAIGMDLFLAKFFALGVGVGYHFVSEFENRIGSEKNHSSPEVSLSIGLAFGG